MDAGELLNIFTRSITEWVSDADSLGEEDEANDNDIVITIEAAESKENPGKAKQASTKTAAAETLATITDDCDDVLAFLQAVAVKSPQFLAEPLSLRADKRACV